MAFYKEKLESWINDLKTCLESVRTELEVIDKVNGWDPRRVKHIESGLLLYKQKIKDLIKQLRSYQLQPPPADQLDFLTKIKSQVQKLVSSIDNFTSTLGIVMSARPLTSVEQIRPSGGKQKGVYRQQYEGFDSSAVKQLADKPANNPAHFELDTFNTKFKRHIRAVEKSIHTSGSKQKPSRTNSVERSKEIKRNKSTDFTSAGGWRKEQQLYAGEQSDANTPRTGKYLLRHEPPKQHNSKHANTVEKQTGDARVQALESQLLTMSELVKTQKAQIELLTREIGFLKKNNKSLVTKLSHYEQTT